MKKTPHKVFLGIVLLIIFTGVEIFVSTPVFAYALYFLDGVAWLNESNVFQEPNTFLDEVYINSSLNFSNYLSCTLKTDVAGGLLCGVDLTSSGNYDAYDPSDLAFLNESVLNDTYLKHGENLTDGTGNDDAYNPQNLVFDNNSYINDTIDSRMSASTGNDEAYNPDNIAFLNESLLNNSYARLNANNTFINSNITVGSRFSIISDSSMETVGDTETVGIGTLNPNATLDVHGSFHVVEGDYSVGEVEFGTPTQPIFTRIWTTDGSVTDTLMIQDKDAQNGFIFGPYGFDGVTFDSDGVYQALSGNIYMNDYSTGDVYLATGGGKVAVGETTTGDALMRVHGTFDAYDLTINGSTVRDFNFDSYNPSDIAFLNESILNDTYLRHGENLTDDAYNPQNLVFDNNSYINDTIDSKLVSTTYYPFSVITFYGTNAGGNQVGNISFYDDDTYNVTEDSGSNPLDVRINFTGITSFDSFIYREKYAGGSGHEIITQFWNYDSGDWETYGGMITDQSGLVSSPEILVSDSAEHISGGVVQFRFNHISIPGLTQHIFYVDFVQLIDGTSTLTTIEHDSLAGRDDEENHPWALPKTTFAEDNTTIWQFIDYANFTYMRYTDAFDVSLNVTIANIQSDVNSNSTLHIADNLTLTNMIGGINPDAYNPSDIRFSNDSLEYCYWNQTTINNTYVNEEDINISYGLITNDTGLDCSKVSGASYNVCAGDGTGSGSFNFDDYPYMLVNDTTWNSTYMPVAFGEIWNITFENSSAGVSGMAFTINAMKNLSQYYSIYDDVYSNFSLYPIRTIEKMSCGLNNNMLCDNDNLTILGTGTYDIEWQIGYRGAAVVNNITVSVLVNNLTDTRGVNNWGECMATGSVPIVAGWYDMDSGCYLQLNQGDVLSLGMFDELTADAVWTIRSVRLRAMRLM